MTPTQYTLHLMPTEVLRESLAYFHLLRHNLERRKYLSGQGRLNEDCGLVICPDEAIDLPAPNELSAPKPPVDYGDEEDNLVRYAKDEMMRAGLYDADSDYGGMLANAVMNLVKAFSGEGHSGCSAGMAMDIFNKLARFQPLTPLSSDPTEWQDMGGYGLNPGEKSFHQSTRQPNVFSRDSGVTWYCLDDPSIDNGDSLAKVQADYQASKAGQPPPFLRQSSTFFPI